MLSRTSKSMAAKSKPTSSLDLERRGFFTNASVGLVLKPQQGCRVDPNKTGAFHDCEKPRKQRVRTRGLEPARPCGHSNLNLFQQVLKHETHCKTQFLVFSQTDRIGLKPRNGCARIFAHKRIAKPCRFTHQLSTKKHKFQYKPINSLSSRLSIP